MFLLFYIIEFGASHNIILLVVVHLDVELVFESQNLFFSFISIFVVITQLNFFLQNKCIIFSTAFVTRNNFWAQF